MTRNEVASLLGEIRGTHALVATLLYGSGLRLLESLRLRVQDLEFGRRQIVVREGKGRKDRVTFLPQNAAEVLREQLDRARDQHRRDLADGAGRVKALQQTRLREPFRGW